MSKFAPLPMTEIGKQKASITMTALLRRGSHTYIGWGFSLNLFG